MKTLLQKKSKTMNKQLINILFSVCVLMTLSMGCKIPAAMQKQVSKETPQVYTQETVDTTNSAIVKWKDFFRDPYLVELIDTALNRNQELQVTLQEIEIARNEVRAKKGELLPSVGYGAGTGIEKVGRYTSQGAGDASTDIIPGKLVPDALGDFRLGLNAEWEVDIWHKLHNTKEAEVDRYLATIEGKNFVLSNLIAEVSNAYYDLLALDNQLSIIQQSIKLQQDALEVVKIQKQAARATELAVQKFEAEIKKSQSMEFDLRQRITETENRMNFLLGRYPQHIARSTGSFKDTPIQGFSQGIPSQLLENRPDVRQAEWELRAAALDVKVAKAKFYPSLNISAATGLQAFNPSYLVKLPESLLFSLAGDIAGPLINKNAIKAAYGTANAKQIQAAYNYERSLLNAYMEVANQLSGMDNLNKSYIQKTNQVAALKHSIEISNDLFKAARADYLEVLLTQRDALEATLDLIEVKKDQLSTVVNIYKALGGGWR